MTDVATIISAQKKDKKSLKILFEQYYGIMKNICIRYAKDELQSSELLNSGFYSMINSINEFEPGAIEFQKWLSDVLIKNSISFLKSNEREYYVTTTAKANDPDWDNKSTIMAKIFIEDLNAIPDSIIIQCIQELPPSHRAIFNLHLIDGYELEEVSKIMEINIETCKRNLERGRNNFEKNIRSKVLLP